jgi:hypothetical protein
VRLPRLWRRQPELDLLSTDPKVLFGQTVGVEVPPDADLHEFTDKLASQWTRESMQRLNSTRARGLWTPEMEDMWAMLGELPDSDPRIEDLVRALTTEVVRVERENPED